MTLLIPPGYADVAIVHRCDGDPDPWLVTFGVDVGDTSGTGQAIGDQCIAAWEPILDEMPNIVHLDGAKITVGQDGADNIRYFIAPDTPFTGSNTGAKLPQNCAALIHKDTAIGGRRAKGRFFLPLVLGEGEVDQIGVISGNMKGNIQTAVNSFMTALSDGADGLEMVILHNSEGVSDPIDPTPVTGLRVDPIVSTQRRRLR